MASEQLENQRLERLHGINITDDSIVFFVTSTGCTDKKDFKCKVDTGFTGQTPVNIALTRIIPDTCKAMPHVVEVKFTLKELGIKGAFEVELLNKVGTSFMNL